MTFCLIPTASTNPKAALKSKIVAEFRVSYRMCLCQSIFHPLCVKVFCIVWLDLVLFNCTSVFFVFFFFVFCLFSFFWASPVAYGGS